MHPRKIGGTTLLETVIAATLLATVGLAATSATRFISDRGRTDVVEQQVLDRVRTQLVNIRATARANTIPTTGTSSTVTTLPGVKGNVSIDTTYSVASETSNVVMTSTTATWNDPTSRSVVVNSAFNKNARPRIASFKFASSSSPAISQNAFMGMVPAPNWNVINSSFVFSYSSLLDSIGGSFMGTVIALGAQASQYTDNLIPASSANSPGQNFVNLFGSGLTNSSMSLSIFYISPVPFAKYDLIVNAGLGASGVTGSYMLTINTRPTRTLSVPGISDASRRQFVVDQNTFIERDLTDSYVLVYIWQGSATVALHGIQIIEKP